MHKANVYKMPHAWNVSKHEKKKNLNKRIVMSKVLRAFPCEIQVHLWDYTSICISIVQGNTITKVNILASSTQIRIRYRQ